jgi:wyosine [tRNA(Phe)-imidazoG37] synthetase (radical SAM superfamily)
MPDAPLIPAFRSHPRVWEGNTYVYPVLSRRARGLSVGINLSPHKACNMDCVYCQVDRSVPGPTKTVDLDVVSRELADLLAEAVSGRIFAEPPFAEAPDRLKVLGDIAFSGDGEPTSFRGFLDACRRVIAAKDAAGVPDLPVRTITNAIDLDRAEVIEAMALLDDHGGEIWAKLDAGTQAYFDRVARTKTPLDKVVRNIAAAAKLRPVVIQALFMETYGEGPGGAEIDAWCARLEEMVDAGGRISLVQVYTVARAPAESWVGALATDELERIAAQVTERLGIPAEVY